MPRIPPRPSNIDIGTPALQDGPDGASSPRRSRRLQGLAAEQGPLQSPRRTRSSDTTRPVGSAQLPATSSPAPAHTAPAAGTPITRGYRQAPMPTHPQQLRAIHANAQLANYVYTRDPKSLPGDWAPSTDLAEHLCAALRLPPQLQVDRGFGTLVDQDSGLAATVLVSPQAKEVVVAFGGTTAGAVAGSAAQRVIGNLSPMMTQWGANVGAGLGWLPTSYEQAATALHSLGNVVGQGDWAGYTLRTVGHSKGGGEAAYAALAQPTPLKADIFSPAHLSHGLIDKLPGVNVIQAPDLVRAYSVETDIVPGLRNIPGGTIDGVGTEHFIPVDLGTGTSMLSVHERFVQHLETYMRRCEDQGG